MGVRNIELLAVLLSLRALLENGDTKKALEVINEIIAEARKGE